MGLALDSDEVAVPNPDGWYYDKDDKDWRCILWADNWPAMRFFTDFSTQWRHGFSGPTGLDYGVILHELDRMGLDKDAYDDLFGAIRVMEREALNELRPKA